MNTPNTEHKLSERSLVFSPSSSFWNSHWPFNVNSQVITKSILEIKQGKKAFLMRKKCENKANIFVKGVHYVLLSQPDMSSFRPKKINLFTFHVSTTPTNSRSAS